MDDDLDKAAAEGRAKREAAAAEKARDQARRDEAERFESERRFWASVSRWGIFRVSGMGFYYLLLFYLFVLVPLNIVILVWLRPPDWLFHLLVPGRGRLYLPIIATLVAIGMWYVAGAMCRRGVVRERAWVASLPFAVSGYEERLGVYPSSAGKDLAFTLRFTGDAPAADVIRDVLSSDGGTWKLDEATGLATRGRLETRWARSKDHNRPEVCWFHALAQAQLRTLHARHPIARITRAVAEQGDC